MTDRELLELAAKAAHRSVQWDGAVMVLNDPAPNECSAWNPLADDGDALRLAVKLQLSIFNEHLNGCVAYCDNGERTFPSVHGDENGGGEIFAKDYAATRRAIVFAAAEIGKLM